MKGSFVLINMHVFDSLFGFDPCLCSDLMDDGFVLISLLTVSVFISYFFLGSLIPHISMFLDSNQIYFLICPIFGYLITQSTVACGVLVM